MAEELGERELLMEALVDVVAERGFESTEGGDVARAAGLHEVVFARHFESMTECYEEAYRRAWGQFFAAVLPPYEAEEVWRDGVRACAYTAAEYLRAHPNRATFGVVPALAVSDRVAADRDRAFQRVVDILDDGRKEMDDPDSAGRHLAEATLGSIYDTLMRQMTEGKGSANAEPFIPELMYLAVRPYLGHEVATEELTIPAPNE